MATQTATDIAENPLSIVSQGLFINMNRQITHETAIQSKKIFQAKNTLGETEVHKLVVFVLRQFSDSLNLSLGLSPLQLIEIAYAFMDRYTHNSVDDLILCLKQVKSGAYGPIYNRIDQQTIFGFMAKYEEEKSLHQENTIRNEKAREASNVNAILDHLPEETKKAILEYNPERPEPLKPQAIPSEQEYKAIILEWMPTATDNEIEAAIGYYMRHNAKEYILLMEKEHQRRQEEKQRKINH